MHTTKDWSQFTFFELWNPWLFGFILVVAAAYAIGTNQMRRRIEEPEPFPVKRKLSFYGGLFILYVAAGSPLQALGHHYLFSAHMMQQSLMFFFVPPLLLLGTPTWLIRPLFQNNRVRKWTRVLTNPILAVGSFNILLSFYHFPIIFDFMMSHSILGSFYHFAIFITSIQMWWLITCPLPEYERLSELKKMAYIVVNGLLLYPACAAIIFAGKPLYMTYMHAPQLFAFLPPEDDQQFGGVIMKLMQEAALIFVLALNFFKWYRRERQNDNADTQQL
ncbi:cytochrome c oxidase assembly protein [Paenibacillus sp. GYB004]|uniref:cytochrome c oxidase assembly protein n=1 Tax=Paenibacillus sp. GYB004 TaxID=2994393 RepID=UPI002F9680BE